MEGPKTTRITVFALATALGGVAQAQQGFWDDVKPVAGVNSRFVSELGPSISADGLSLYFGARDLYVAEREKTDEPFQDPVNLVEVNTPFGDDNPYISADGLALYFNSTRSGGKGGWDLYVATRANKEEPFEEPVNLEEVNTPFLEGMGSVSPDGLTLYFHSNRPGGLGDRDLYLATRGRRDLPFGNVRNLVEINSRSADAVPSISSDGLTLIWSDLFGSWRVGGHGGIDIWMATRRRATDPFGKPRNLSPPLNTNANEATPGLSADWPAPGSELYFIRWIPGGQRDIYQATWHLDCNGNGVDDLDDIQSGTSQDANGNGKPDECDLPLGRFTLTPQSGEVPLEVEVDAGASEPGFPGTSIVSYTWDFGDGATAQGTTAKHTYASPGHFEISLTVADDRGVTGTVAKKFLALFPAQLDPPWSASDVGEAEPPGGARFGTDCLEILGLPGNVSSRSDDFHFAHQRVAGDFLFTARVSEWDETTTGAKLGLMVRETLDPDARHGSVVLDRRSNGIFTHRFLRRERAGETTRRRSHDSYDHLNLWLRIERQGTVISGRLSLDGMNWTAPDTVELAGLPEQTYVGVASSRRETDGTGALPLASVCDLELLVLPGQPQFLRGDCNDDGNVDISDAVCILNWLFLGGATPGCVAVTNTNGDDAANITDATYLLGHLFSGGPAPAASFPECGPGTEADTALGCQTLPQSCQ